MIFKINPDFKNIKADVDFFFENFDKSGTNFIIGERNNIKIFEVNELKINIKAFKVPNFLNKIVYRFFRESKAERSFKYANILISKGIGTPTPIAFRENYNLFGLHRSYYASIHQDYDLTFRELVEIKNYPDGETILRQFTKFCYKMHEAGIEFKDHSPGNTLIKKTTKNQYEFYLVDLNRMNFHESIDIELRMKNLSRLTPKKSMVKIITDEYAKCSGADFNLLFNLMWTATQRFQKKYYRKKRLKKKLLFWR